ncbi:hypothetical protein ACFVTX_08110 [Agromyces sp. NPDC058136]|uniref:hypothetical protein n=1 Tax=Agromyces sp. NPDC058136 TaxID=3346354 RepID=UPI0036DE29A2
MDCEPYRISCQLTQIADAIDAAPDWWEVAGQVVIVIGALAAAIFAGWGVWQRFRYQARPVWVFRDIAYVDSTVTSGTRDVELSIANHGDGAAFDVVLRSRRDGRTARLRRHHYASRAPGEAITFVRPARKEITATEPARVHEFWSGDAALFDFEGEVVEVVWSQVPNRKRRRVQSFALDKAQKDVNADGEPTLLPLPTIIGHSDGSPSAG